MLGMCRRIQGFLHVLRLRGTFSGGGLYHTCCSPCSQARARKEHDHNRDVEVPLWNA